MTRPLRAVLYPRRSSMKQADRNLSVPAQLEACRLHAQRKGWLVTGEYHDDGISGFEDERRPAFRRMLADMVEQPRPFDVIVVWDFSRIAAVIAVRRPTVTHPKTIAGSYLLSGLLVCDACGAPYIGHGAKNGRHQYYTCQTKQKQGAKACPKANNFEQGKVEGVVLDALRDGALHPGVFADLVREVQASLRTGQADAEGERLVLEGQLAEVTRRLDNLYEAVESGSIPVARLAPRIEQVSQEKEALDARIAALPEAGTEPLLDIGDDDIEGWVADLRAVVDRGSVDERRGLLRAWVKRVVARGDELTVEYTFPLVNVPGPGGSEPSGAPSTRRVVNRRGRHKPAMLQPETAKGEPAFRRVLPTVQYGSPLRGLT